MKKTRFIKIPPPEPTEREISDYFCDICTEFLGHTLYQKNVCDICERHCHNNWKCGADHPEDHGDYPRTLCKICLDLYGKLMIPLQHKNEQAEEAMLERIRRVSLNEYNATT